MIKFISAVLLYNATSALAMAITYVVPTEPFNSHCPSLQGDCFTLNEWIESGTLFTNGSTVSLLSGIHSINSSLNFLLVQHVSSVIFTGHPHEQTIVECNYRFAFKFYDVKEVNISNIQFKFCSAIDKSTEADISFTLIFIAFYNILVNSIKIYNCGVLATVGSNEGSAFRINNSALVTGFYLSSLLQSCLLW